MLTWFYNNWSFPHTHKHTVSAKMGGSPQRFFLYYIWMALTAIHKNTLLEDCEDCDNILFLILPKPACARSPSTDPLVCVMDAITTFIAWNIMPLY